MADEETQPAEDDAASLGTEPAAVPPAVINSAQYDYDGVTVMLMITKDGSTDQTLFALSQTDPYGMAPFLRVELQRMVDAGEITIQPAPQMPADE